MEQYSDMVQALKDLRQRGYSIDFSLLPDCLYCASKSLKLKPEDLRLRKLIGLKASTAVLITMP